MNWKSFSSRLLLVVVAFPVLGVLIFLAPGLHLLPYTIAVVAASVVGALETRGFSALGESPQLRTWPRFWQGPSRFRYGWK